MKNLNLTIPGTTLKYSEAARNDSFSMIAPVLEATGGLTLSQLSTLTGLEGTTIQNWIKRGWVTATKGIVLQSLKLRNYQAFQSVYHRI